MAEIPTYNKRMITISVMLAAILQVIDTTIANVALPHIQGSLSATQDQIAWVLTSYIVSSAIMTALIGWISNRFGTKKIFLVSVLGFVVSSILCGISMSITEIVLFRVLQGVFGAALVPLSQSTLLNINPPEQHGSAMAIWSIGVMVGPILGPSLGGYLTEYYNWRWIFYVNVPVGILAFLGILLYFPDSESENSKFDFIGFGLLAIAITCIQLALDRGEQVDWLGSKEIIAYIVITIISLWFFIWHTIYAINPFIKINMFKDLNFLIGLIVIFFLGVLLNASTMLLPPFLQNLMQYPVIDAGILMVPRGIGTMLAISIVSKIINRVKTKFLILFGLILLSFSLKEMTYFNLSVPEHLIVLSGFIQGFGFGFIFVPLSTITFSTLLPKQRTEAAGFYSLMRNIGGSIGISIANVVLSHSVQINHAYLAEYITPYNSKIALYYTTNFANNILLAPFNIINQEITKQAYLIAYLNDFKFMFIMSLIMMPLVLLIRSQKIIKQAPSAVIE
ncbi:Multidrug export protein EmrB [Rickettsiales bacterium Ac37b]|nr:Multidrug export protein EmrB [Rickettsiales bacterium Ac37b]